MSEAEIDHQSAGLKHLIVPELTSIAEIDGKPWGPGLDCWTTTRSSGKLTGRLFPFGWLRLLTGKRKIDRLRLISTNVLPEYQKWGLGSVRSPGSFPMPSTFGIQVGEFSWVLESNSFRGVPSSEGVPNEPKSIGFTIFAERLMIQQWLADPFPRLPGNLVCISLMSLLNLFCRNHIHMPQSNVVITGFGVVSSIGIGCESFFKALMAATLGSPFAGGSYRRTCTARDFPSQPPGLWIGGTDLDFDPKQYVRPRKALKVMCREIQPAFAASQLAIDHAGWGERLPADPDGDLSPQMCRCRLWQRNVLRAVPRRWRMSSCTAARRTAASTDRSLAAWPCVTSCRCGC